MAIHTPSRFQSPLQTPTKPLQTPTKQNPKTIINSPRSYHSPAQLKVPSSRSRGNSEDSLLDIEERRKQISCDVILDGFSTREDGTFVDADWVSSFLATLGSRLKPASSTSSGNPSTPSKPSRANSNTVINALRELSSTESSYLRKLSSLHDDYEIPLRSRSNCGGPVSNMQAKALFENLDSLIQISTRFNQVLSDLESSNNEAFGRKIYECVEDMQPFVKWLSNYQVRQSTLDALKKTQGWHTQIDVLDDRSISSTTGTGASFTMLLGEPFQRVSRYGLLFSVISNHLSDDDPNVPYLDAAIRSVEEICRMSKEGETLEKAILWALGEVITDLPSDFVSKSRKYLTCIDIDEKVAIASSDTGLETSLFLFSDVVLMVKRNSRGSEAKKMAGLDNEDNLIALYESSMRGGIIGGIGGSAMKLKSKRMGFRGVFPIQDISLIDLGGHDIGMVLKFPPEGLSGRWNGRPNRFFSVSDPSTSNQYHRATQKSTFLSVFGQAKCADRAKVGWIALKGNSISEPKEEGIESSRIFFGVCKREDWDDGMSKKCGFILHLCRGEESVQTLDVDAGTVLISALIVGNKGNKVKLESRGREMIIIELPKLVSTLITISSEENLFNFPLTITNLSPVSSSRSRPRSFLTNAFSSSLNRGRSGASATSSFASSRSSASRVSSSATDSLLTRERSLRVAKSAVEMSSSTKMMMEVEEVDEADQTIIQARALRRRSSLPIQPPIFSASPRYGTNLDSPITINPMSPGTTASPRRLLGPRAPTPQMDLFSPTIELASPNRSPERMSIDLDLHLDQEAKKEEEEKEQERLGKRILADLSPRASPPKRITPVPTQRVVSYDHVTLSRPRSANGPGSRRGKKIGGTRIENEEKFGSARRLFMDPENNGMEGDLVSLSRSPRIGNSISHFAGNSNSDSIDLPRLDFVEKEIEKTFEKLEKAKRDWTKERKGLESQLRESRKEKENTRDENHWLKNRNTQNELELTELRAQVQLQKEQHAANLIEITDKNELGLVNIYTMCEAELTEIERVYQLPEPVVPLGNLFKQTLLEKNQLSAENSSLRRQLEFEKGRERE